MHYAVVAEADGWLGCRVVGRLVIRVSGQAEMGWWGDWKDEVAGLVGRLEVAVACRVAGWPGRKVMDLQGEEPIDPT